MLHDGAGFRRRCHADEFSHIGRGHEHFRFRRSQLELELFGLRRMLVKRLSRSNDNSTHMGRGRERARGDDWGDDGNEDEVGPDGVRGGSARTHVENSLR